MSESSEQTKTRQEKPTKRKTGNRQLSFKTKGVEWCQTVRPLIRVSGTLLSQLPVKAQKSSPLLGGAASVSVMRRSVIPMTYKYTAFLQTSAEGITATHVKPPTPQQAIRHSCQRPKPWLYLSFSSLPLPLLSLCWRCWQSRNKVT